MTRQPSTHAGHDDMLRRIGESRILAGLLPGALLVAAAAFACFHYAGSQTLEVLCLFTGSGAVLVALAAWTSGAHLRNAAAGTRRGRRVPDVG